MARVPIGLLDAGFSLADDVLELAGAAAAGEPLASETHGALPELLRRAASRLGGEVDMALAEGAFAGTEAAALSEAAKLAGEVARRAQAGASTDAPLRELARVRDFAQELLPADAMTWAGPLLAVLAVREAGRAWALGAWTPELDALRTLARDLRYDVLDRVALRLLTRDRTLPWRSVHAFLAGERTPLVRVLLEQLNDDPAPVPAPPGESAPPAGPEKASAESERTESFAPTQSSVPTESFVPQKPSGRTKSSGRAKSAASAPPGGRKRSKVEDVAREALGADPCVFFWSDMGDKTRDTLDEVARRAAPPGARPVAFIPDYDGSMNGVMLFDRGLLRSEWYGAAEWIAYDGLILNAVFTDANTLHVDAHTFTLATPSLASALGGFLRRVGGDRWSRMIG
jgi:hypothetical protein